MRHRSQADSKLSNRRRVLAEIHLNGPIARSRIAANTGLTPASISRIARSLIDSGLIEEGEPAAIEPRVGRKFVDLRIRPGSRYLSAIAINAFRQDVVVADFTNRIVAHRRLRFPDLNDAEAVIETCASTLALLIDELDIDRRALSGCGIAITGAVDTSVNRLRSAPALGWGDVDLQSIVLRHLDCPIHSDNIPNAKNLAAHCFGPTRKADHVLLFNASLAIGCSLMIEGRLFRGHECRAGMIESMRIPQGEGGRLLPVDRVAGGIGVLGETKERPDAGDAERLVDLMAKAEAGDAGYCERLRSAGRSLGTVILNADSLLHPDRLLLSGPLLDASAYLEGALEEIARWMPQHTIKDRLAIVPMTSYEAAQSLAVHALLFRDEGFVRRCGPSSSNEEGSPP
ncbi:MAG: ROK family transcriptional regulator [Ectothiorhodospiraceae bacterium AqS1]|nr:ROK family transcriptional regulator [Ectothiorhodospiraceae bacterium AqS1]